MSPKAESTTWESSWEVEFPASEREHLLVALVVRDLVHGMSIDLELADSDSLLAVDYLAGDEGGEGEYKLLLTASVAGPESPDSLQKLTESVLDELIVEAEDLVQKSELIASEPLEALEFRTVSEEEERWDLVVPDWLAPDGAEVPFGFRPMLVATGSPWPSDVELGAHGRVVLVPYGDTAHLYGIPVTADEDGELPVVR